MSPTPNAFPLYDERYEHDACGVGFVAATRADDRVRVLPLALAGLAALGHRGAFAADGESSDGAGVALPLEPGLRARLAPGIRGRPAVLMLFLPAEPGGSRRAQGMVRDALRAQGLSVAAWRDVPVVPEAVGSEARSSMPHVAQAIVPGVTSDDRVLGAVAFERRLLVARRQMELWCADLASEGFAVVSASSRTVVYKGLVAGDALGRLYPDLVGPSPALSYAIFHQRYATNTTPRWPLAQPFRRIAHNGEINTVRGNREQLRGRSAELGSAVGEALAALGPLLSAGGSDSLSLDEVLDLLVASGWDLPAAMLLAMPEALSLRERRSDAVERFQRRTRGLLAPWDGPAAMCFGDGRRVGALLDRNGLRPAAWTITRSGLVTMASEAGAVPIDAAEVAERGRLGPGEMLLVDVAAGAILRDAEAKDAVLARPDRGDARAHRSAREDDDRPVTVFHDGPGADAQSRTPEDVRWLAGLDAERMRMDIRTMALEGREPLWSMGDDTPTPALGRLDRRLVDHLRQSFAQVTNPAIDPERERIVMDLAVEVGRRAPLLGRVPRRPLTLHLTTPFVADVDGLVRAFRAKPTPARRIVTLDATWSPAQGASALAHAVEHLAAQGLRAAERGAALVIVSDRRVRRASGGRRLAIPSALAVGAVHTALTDAGLRGRTDLVADASDVLDVHAAAMGLAAGATAISPWLAAELAAEVAGGRGAEDVSVAEAVGRLIGALDRGLRKTLARMGISTAASYVGGQFFEAIELDAELLARCFPAAPAWPGSVGFAAIAERQLRRLGAVASLPRGDRLPDPGRARYRGDGEAHLYAPPIVKAIQALAGDGDGSVPTRSGDVRSYRLALARPPAVVRDQLELRAARAPVPVEEVEPALSVARRFVGAAMSLGALSPEAHQTLTLGLRRIGGASNSGEGGEDPSWYVDDGGPRRDTSIKQVASARFGVTAAYLSRAEQLEIKIAQGSKPGEGGQLPAIKVTPLIASLRRAQPGQSLISPPPHHDIYSIEDLAQLIADLRAINPSARIGVKLVSALGVGTIAAGVAKAGADYVQVSGHSGGTGASPLSSIKHAGTPWELGVSETHQVLMRNGMRDRIALRTDGGLQTGRDVVMAALLGAEEFGFGTAALVAIGCDMARQCHLDTCPTGIATQRDDLRAKFTGTPEDVERFFLAIAHDAREELAALGFRSVGEAVGRVDVLRAMRGPRTLDLSGITDGPVWTADAERRERPDRASRLITRAQASPTEVRLAAEYLRLPGVQKDARPPHLEHAEHGVEDDPATIATITNAERSFGAHVAGLMERGVIRRPVRWRVTGSAGQSFGAFAGPGVDLTLLGQANDYVGKGLSGGTLVVRPEDDLLVRARDLAIAGNTCLYGATGGRVHIVGRAGMRFAVRNSGAHAVVEGIGAHGCEYMTGGVVVVLGSVGRNLCAGMTGGRVYLHDPAGDRVTAADGSSVAAVRLADVSAREDGADRIEELRSLLHAHRDAGSLLARESLQDPTRLGGDFWLLEAVVAPAPASSLTVRPSVDRRIARS